MPLTGKQKAACSPAHRMRAWRQRQEAARQEAERQRMVEILEAERAGHRKAVTEALATFDAAERLMRIGRERLEKGTRDRT